MVNRKSQILTRGGLSDVRLVAEPKGSYLHLQETWNEPFVNGKDSDRLKPTLKEEGFRDDKRSKE